MNAGLAAMPTRRTPGKPEASAFEGGVWNAPAKQAIKTGATVARIPVRTADLRTEKSSRTASLPRGERSEPSGSGYQVCRARTPRRGRDGQDARPATEALPWKILRGRS